MNRFHPTLWQVVTRITAGKTMGHCTEDLCDHILDALAEASDALADTDDLDAAAVQMFARTDR